ncbi:hypothetical protein [Flavobacterium suzhouense]|uniref:Grasp-with-spasm system SPASM domain peptide maturase n=1 Tax=Flavobacterium suzhouense TaxID=1529638 RepID=A0ABW5NV27_9FLAO
MMEQIDEKNYTIDPTSGELLLKWLNEHNLAFETSADLVDCFSHVNDDIEIPYKFVTAVIEISNITVGHLQKLNAENVNGNIGQFNLILSENTSIDSLTEILNFINENEADTFEITFENGFKYSSELLNLLDSTAKILIINNYADVTLPSIKRKGNRYINPIDPVNLHLSLNYLSYFESLENNIYFNKKIFIGKDGEIKNSYETEGVVGHINNDDEINLSELLESDEMTKLWHINKEEVAVCRDCEFRRFCVDSRIPVFTDNYWKYNVECAYNPYISKWSHEDGYMSLKDSGVKIDSNQVTMDLQKLAKINQSLWE